LREEAVRLAGKGLALEVPVSLLTSFHIEGPPEIILDSLEELCLAISLPIFSDIAEAWAILLLRIREFFLRNKALISGVMKGGHSW